VYAIGVMMKQLAKLRRRRFTVQKGKEVVNDK
jgi:hypothetical protein